ncbi:MAG: hypothetical protein HZA31_07350 [Opitutae bacterium]|nr:hypothetical protein [Opitutae bacterium]
MNQSKFIELLNLYVDQEIDPADAALLEEEIQRNPERRQLYLQYCRMHRASTVLFEQYRAEAAPAAGSLAEAARAADRKVIAFPTQSRRRTGNWLMGAGLVAAAACVAVVFIRRPQQSETQMVGGTTVAQVKTAPAPSAPVAAVPVAAKAFVPVTAPAARPTFTPVFVAHPLNQAAAANNQAPLLASDQEAFSWMHRVQLAPVRTVSPDELVFESKPAATREQELRTFTGARAGQFRVENAAFQFQR